MPPAAGTLSPQSQRTWVGMSARELGAGFRKQVLTVVLRPLGTGRQASRQHHRSEAGSLVISTHRRLGPDASRPVFPPRSFSARTSWFLVPPGQGVPC